MTPLSTWIFAGISLLESHAIISGYLSVIDLSYVCLITSNFPLLSNQLLNNEEVTVRQNQMSMSYGSYRLYSGHSKKVTLKLHSSI